MSKETQNNNEQLQRGLKRRHLQMIAIGGSIGTGLFLAMGGTIRDAGPGGAIVGYAIMGIVVYLMMTALGEMATRYPVPGAFTAYANRFVDQAWGFTNGWSYWFGSSMTVAAGADRRRNYCKVLVPWNQFDPLGGIIFSCFAGVEPVQRQRLRRSRVLVCRH